MESVCLQVRSVEHRCDFPRPHAAKGFVRLFAVCAVLWAAAPAQPASAAILQLVQSGTTTSSANGITTVTLGTAVDTTKSFLVFQARTSANVPGGATVRGRLQTSTTLEFQRVTSDTSTITIQWYLATFGSGVVVQRGETAQTALTVNVPITSVGTIAQAFVLFSKTSTAADTEWSTDEAVITDLTTATNLQIRSSTLNAAHIISWQVVQFTNAADINVQRGTSVAMTAGNATITGTLSPAVNIRKTFVLASWRTADTGVDVGARMLRPQLTNATTVTIDRSNTVPAIAEVAWQAIELKDASTVWTGNATFASGSAQTTAVLGSPDVNVDRAVGFISGQGGNGQSMGRSAYILDDVPGVASATTSLAFNQITMDRTSTVAAADVSWFVVQFDGGTPFKVGSFTTSLTTGTQTIAHGLGQVPKALLLWTEGRNNESFSSPSGITFRSAAQAGSVATPGTIVQDVIVSADRTTNSTTVTTGTFTTASPNELLIAMVSGGGTTQTVTGVTGAGLNWVLVRSTGTRAGTAELWRAFAPAVLTGQTVTATFSQSSRSSITVMSFTGVDTSGTDGSGAIGATGTGNSAAGAPTASLTTTRDGSAIVAAGNDPTNDVARTVGPGQFVIHEYINATVADSYWAQVYGSLIANSGTTVTINDTAPTGNAYNLSIAELLATPPTLTINKPAGTVQNDVMIASIAVRPDTTIVITPPAGWTLIRRTDNTPVPFPNSLAVYYKVAGGAEPANYSWSFNTGNGQAGGIMSFIGVDTTDPVDIDLGQNTPVGFSHSAPSVTTTSSNDMIVTSHAFASAESFTPPAGMTEAVDASSVVVNNAVGQSLEMNYVLQPVIGATGVRTATVANIAGNDDAGNGHTLALRPATPAYFGFGMTDGTTSKALSAASRNYGDTTNTASRVANKAITIVKWDTATIGIVLGEADLQSWDSTNIVLNWTTNDSFPYVIHYLALGGTDLSAKVIGWTTGTTTGNRAVTGVGFRPNLVLHAHGGFSSTAAPPSTIGGAAFGLGVMDGDGDQWANGFFALDAVGTSDSQRGQRTDSVIYSFDQSQVVQKKASWVSMDANGFTVNFSTAASANDAQVFSLALAGLNAAVGSFNKSTAAAPASQAITGTGFKPAAVLLTSVQDVTQAAPVAHTRFGLGASDGTTEGSVALQDQNAAAVATVAGIDKVSKVFVKVDNSTPTINAEADFTTNDADGFTVSWSTNDAVATEILYLAMGPMAVTEVRLTSFEAAKYTRGVLLQWKTGYEIDNLGFNVYREIDGIRTRLNSALIAGSGLAAGQGGVVTGERTYARWDLDPAAQDLGATYWLEDVEFNGTTKLHGPITAFDSEMQEPTTEDSDEIGDANDVINARRIFFSTNEDAPRTGPRVSAPEAPPEVAAQWTLAATAGVVKIGVRKPGWYRVTQPELATAGLAPGVDPRTLRLFADGAEQAIRVIGETDGHFDAADAIEFYGIGLDTPYTDTRTYWLEAGAGPGQRIAVDASGTPQRSLRSGFSSMLRRKDRTVYSAGLRNGEAENWFGSIVFQQPAEPDPDNPWAPVTMTLTPNHIDRSSTAPAQLTVSLQGVTTTSDGTENHRVGVQLNGTDVGEMIFAGQTHAEQTFPVSLIDGENTVTLLARGGDAAIDTTLVDAIKLDYPHTYTADADRLRFTVDAPVSVSVGGFAGTSIRVFDVTNRIAPIELPPTVATLNGLSTVTVNVPGTGLRTLLAFSEETVAAAESVRANLPSTLHATTNANDYVIISHADFLAPLATLATHRQGQGHQAVAVDVEDVYDEFSFGEKTPQALKDFLQWARGNWQTAPRFVVLAGDATINPRDYEGLGNFDFVPTKEVEMHDVGLETASDDWFVDFNDDGVPEVAIGRLPVRTSLQAQAMVDKIVGYNQAPPAAWMKDLLLVADANDSTGSFEEMSDELAALVPSGYTAQKVYKGVLGPVAAHQALFDGVNSGQLIVNYTGHGSTNMWGNGGELLTNDDVASWTNVGKLPFIVAMNCLNGLFNGIFGEESLAEAMMRAPGAGAVAAWASSSATPPAVQSLVNQELFRLIFNGTYTTVGEAVAAAKRVVGNQDLRRSWIYFGDPAMQLSGAPRPTSTIPPAITTHPQSAPIASGGQATLTVAASGAAPLSYQWYRGASGVAIDPIATATSSSFTTPPATTTTSFWARVSNPYGHADSNAAVLSVAFMITTSDPWPPVTVGDAYALQLTATDSTAPYTWQATPLPSGLALNPSTGAVSGSPSAAGTFPISVRVTDGLGAAADKSFTVTIDAASDHLIDEQWHLKDRSLEPGAANVEPAWALTRGAGVVIGIVDDGLEGTHPDLQANYLAALSYDFLDHDADPSPVTAGTCFDTANCQGTAAAGIAAARGGTTASGVAPMASLAGIRLGQDAADADQAAALTHQLDAVHILNNSWKRLDDGRTLVAPGPLAEAAFSTAIARGRAGAGRIFVWAAGDGRAVNDNCNFDGYANSRFGIAVGAVDDTAQQAWYSESCSALLVSAPSSGGNRSLTTTDLAGAPGDDRGDYMSAFGRTAAAAPVVSGVVALMLAQNPVLTWRDVQHILVRSSRIVDPADGGWTTGAFPHSERYGFGVVDGLAATTLAATWPNVAAEAAVAPVAHGVGTAIPDDDAAGVSDSIEIGAQYNGFSIEHVEVEFSAAHPHRGDLEVTLTSPTGVVSHLGTVRTNDAGVDFTGWRFRSVRHWGESAAGTWTLNVADRAAGNTGTFSGWTLRLYGTASAPAPMRRTADFDGDGKADLAVYRPSSGTWFVVNSGSNTTSALQFGNALDVPVPGDYDGDGRTDLAIFRPSTGTWFIVQSGTGAPINTQWGNGRDVPVPADYDGDGKTDLAVYRPSTGEWFILQSSGGVATRTHGGSNAVPAPGDYDGDGLADLAFYRRSTGTWSVLASGTGYTTPVTYPFDPGADVPVPGDYDGDGRTDLALYSASTGVWSLRLSGSVFTTLVTYGWGGASYVPVPADYDGDGLTDIAVFQPSTGVWSILQSTTGFTTHVTYTWGNSSDIPVAAPRRLAAPPRGDFDGDRIADVTVFRPSTGVWYVRQSSGGTSTHTWGIGTDTVVPADYDGDGKTDVAVYRPSTGEWFVLQSSGNYTSSVTVTLGTTADTPVPADYDGDGNADVAVFNRINGMWSIRYSSTGTTAVVAWGNGSDAPVPADYDGDGKADVAVYRPSAGTWFIFYSGTGTTGTVTLGNGQDIAVPADYDGDGKADVAVYRPASGTWMIANSRTGTTTNVQFGSAQEMAVPTDYDGDGQTDVAVFRPSTATWSFLESGTGSGENVQWGAAADIPLLRRQ